MILEVAVPCILGQYVPYILGQYSVRPLICIDFEPQDYWLVKFIVS